MAKAPAWLQPLIEQWVPQGHDGLWIGPSGGVPPLPALRVIGALPELRDERFAALFVAAVEGDLGDTLRSLRRACQPGAVVCLLLPEATSGAGAKLARVFDPLGRAGRKPRDVDELCGALLGMGASKVSAQRHEGQLRCVWGRLPERPQPLDEMFQSDSHATS